MATTMTINLLQGTDDFQAWRNDIKALLQSKMLWEEFIVGDGAAPVQYETEPEHEFLKRLKDYNRGREKAMGILLGSVSKQLKPVIQDFKDPKAAFAKLEEALQPTGLAKYLAPHVKLFSIHLKEGQKLSDYFAEIDDLFARITEEQPNIDDLVIQVPPATTRMATIRAHYEKEVKRLVLEQTKKNVNAFITRWRLTVTLRGLPDSYEIVKGVINTWGNNTTVEQVQSQLRQREAEMAGINADNSSVGAGGALLTGQHQQKKKHQSKPHERNGQGQAKGNPHGYDWRQVKRPRTQLVQQQTRSRPNNESSIPTCSYCHRRGHAHRNCHKRKADLYDASASKPVEERALFCMLSSNNNTKTDKSVWFLDSGAFSNMTPDSTNMYNYRPVSGKYVKTANGQTLHVAGMGDFTAHHLIDGIKTEVKFVDVLHVPDLCYNLLSVSRMRQRGFNTVFGKTIRVYNSATGKTKLHVYARGNLYQVRLFPISPNAGANISSNDAAFTIQDVNPSIDLYHQRYGHISEDRIRHALELQGIKFPADQHISQCEVCIQAKQTRAKIGHGPVWRAEQPLEVVHTDVCGPF